MKLGTALCRITPPMPLRLCGYAGRTGVFEKVEEDLFLRVHIHRQGEKTLVFLYADLLWWGTDFVEKARLCITAEFGIPGEQVLFVASHNHSGPPTGHRFTPSLETYHAGYAAYLHRLVLDGIRQALRDMEEVSATRYDGSAALNVFRRIETDGAIEMRPNYQAEADHTLTLIAFRREDSSLKGCMVHYPCHANLCADNSIQPDYPGVLLRLLDAEYPASVSVFLQGCTGDLRPNSVLGDQFIPAHYAQVCAFAVRLHDHCAALLAGIGTPLTPELTVQRGTVELPLENTPPPKELERLAATGEGIHREWARTVLEQHKGPTERMEITRVRYAKELSLYTFNAEMSQYYAAFARSIEQGALSVAYCNGMIGYISTAEQIRQGGYEPKGSALYFALAGTYSESIEGIIHQTIEDLCRGSCTTGGLRAKHVKGDEHA